MKTIHTEERFRWIWAGRQRNRGPCWRERAVWQKHIKLPWRTTNHLYRGIKDRARITKLVTGELTPSKRNRSSKEWALPTSTMEKDRIKVKEVSQKEHQNLQNLVPTGRAAQTFIPRSPKTITNDCFLVSHSPQKLVRQPTRMAHTLLLILRRRCQVFPIRKPRRA